MNVAIRDLKNKLSEYLRQVQAGQRVVVTDRGRPVAEINPIGRRRLSPRERLRRLIESGDVTPPKDGGLGSVTPLEVSDAPVSKSILDDRG